MNKGSKGIQVVYGSFSGSNITNYSVPACGYYNYMKID